MTAETTAAFLCMANQSGEAGRVKTLKYGTAEFQRAVADKTIIWSAAIRESTNAEVMNHAELNEGSVSCKACDDHNMFSNTGLGHSFKTSFQAAVCCSTFKRHTICGV